MRNGTQMHFIVYRITVHKNVGFLTRPDNNIRTNNKWIHTKASKIILVANLM